MRLPKILSSSFFRALGLVRQVSRRFVGVSGQGGGEDLVDPAGFEDRGDVGFDGVTPAPGLAAGESGLQFGQAFACGRQGLIETA